MKRTTKQLLTILLCLAILPVEGFAAWAKERTTEPPAYMRGLSRLVAATANDRDFGEIQLTIGEPEMEVDGKTQPITDDGNAVPFIDEDGAVQIPAAIFDDVPDNVGAVSPAELEEKGYDVSVNEMAGTITVTEPYGLCRLAVQTKDGTVKNDFGATASIALSDGITVLQYSSKRQTAVAAMRFVAQDDVLFCEADTIWKADTVSEETDYTCWGTTVAGADQFMATLPDDLPQVTVAVIDTGIDANHPFLAGRIANGGWDFVNDDNDPDDDHYHGTHCAGIVRDATPENVQILPVKVLDNMGSGSALVIAEGIRYAASAGAKILSLSLGGQETNETMELAVAYANDQGCAVFAAAGNDGVDLADSPQYPACCDGVIAVAASDASDHRASYSNFGDHIDISAPGSGVNSSVPGGRFRSLSGTSMACPLAAACAALLKSKDFTRTADELLALLYASARDVYTPGRDAQSGSGIVYLGAFRAVESLQISYSHLTLEPIAQAQMTVNFVPEHPSDSTLSYTSSDPAIVTVSEIGLMSTISAGTAQITAHNATQGLSCSITVTVLDGDGCSKPKQISASGYGKMLLQKDGTAFIHGKSIQGYYSSSATNWPFRFYGVSAEPVVDIDRFLSSSCAFLKTDGTLWLCGAFPWSRQRTNRIPQMAIKSDGMPLMGVVSVVDNMALCADGTLWQCKPYNEPIFTPVTDEMDVPITHIRFLGKQCAVTDDGRLYENINGLYLSDFNAITMHLVLNADNTPLQGVMQAYSYLSNTISVRPRNYVVKARYVLLEDGTLLNHLTQTVIATDVCEIAPVGGTVLYARTRDGAVYRETGEQIMKENDMPLCDVTRIVIAGSSLWAQCADGTVWAWGTNDRERVSYISNTAQDVVHQFGLLGIGWHDAQLRQGGLLQELSVDGYSYTDLYYSTDQDAYINILPQTLTAAAQVMTDENTPLTNVRDLIPTDGMLYVCEDGQVYCSGIIDYLGYGSTYYRSSVYAKPYTIAGKQVYLDETGDAVPARYGVQKITLNRQNMAATVGERFSLTASIYPSDTFEPNYYWKSSAPSVASVQGDGTVTAHSAGTAVIYAISRENNKVRGQCVLTVEEDAPVSVTVRQYPVKRAYNVNDAFDPSGGMLTLRYRNGVVRTIFVAAEDCNGFDLSQIGTQIVQIHFAGHTFSYPVTVRRQTQSDDTILSVGWQSLPQKRSYSVGEQTLDPQGGALTIAYNDGRTETVPLSAAMCEGFDMHAVGEQTVQVRYKQFTLAFSIVVAELQIEDVLRINTNDSTVAAVLRRGSKFEPGVSLRARYTNGTEGDYPVTADMCTGQDMHTLGEQDVFVTFMDKTFSFRICVVPDPEQVTAIEIQTPPLVTHYDNIRSVEEIDLTGGTLRICFTDGTEQSVPITREMLIAQNRYVLSKPLEIQCVYAHRTTSFTVYDLPKTSKLVSAELLRIPTQTIYAVGQRVEPNGGIVQAMDADGNSIVFRTDDLKDKIYCAQIGEQEVEFVLNDAVSLYYSIVVVENPEDVPADTSGDPPFALSWVRLPETLLYCLGEPLSVSGGVLLNATGENVSLIEDMCTGFDPLTPGAQTITVTYSGPTVVYASAKTGTSTLTFDVFVTELVLENEAPEIEVGKCTRILATFQPRDVDGREIIWSSSDETIATVDEYGRVIGIAPGEVEIIAQVKGSEAVASCTVTVLPRTAERLPGDADGDGEVTLKDCVQITRYLAGGWDAVIDLMNADVNGDGIVNLKDVVLLRRYLAGGWDVELK